MAKRFLALLAALAVAVGVCPALAPASAIALQPNSDSQSSSSSALHPASVSGAQGAHGFNSITIQADAPWLADNETLLACYADRALRSAIPSACSTDRCLRSIATGPSASTGTLQSQALPEGNTLTAAETRLFKALKTSVCEAASGKRTSTSFQFSISDLRVSSILGTAGIDGDAIAKVIDALLIECPYELYWYDKPVGMSLSFIGDNLIISMAVAPDYQGSNMYTVSTAQSSRINKAVAKAKSIVKANIGKSTLARLKAYKKAICELTSYDYESAQQNLDAQGDPWQLISVFDGDPQTRVACEGYSKAFAYLCDLSAFDDVTCYIVNGVMASSDGSESHMWNIVRMDDGKNYLADVTNCDTGSIGAPDELFLVPKTSGTVTTGYMFEANGQQVMYLYDSAIVALLGKANLTVSDTPYVSVPRTSIAKAKVAVQGSRVYNGKAQAPKAAKVKVTLAGKTLKPGTDYTVTYQNAKGKAVAAAKVKSAGTYTVVVKGKGVYKGTAKGTFTIKKAANPVVVKATSKTVAAAKVKASAQTVKPLSVAKAKGKVTYKKASGSSRLTVNKTTGKVKVKAGTKAGTYKAKVKVRAAGTANYKAKTKTVIVKVVVC